MIPLEKSFRVLTNNLHVQERLRGEIAQLQRQCEELQHNINNCDNAALRMRFKESLYKVETDIKIREMDIESFQMFS